MTEVMNKEVINKTREVKQVFKGTPTTDGDGVQLTRLIGTTAINALDPFLLFDAFGSDKPLDYIGGFPAHPHRGFETVSYMLAGKMRHKDSAGHEGVIEAGGIQWMTAGRGIIHSEMPEQEEGLLSGLQLWVNLPASHKMMKPNYQEKNDAEIPVTTQDNGIQIKVISGVTKDGTKGAINNEFVDPFYWDIHQQAHSTLNEIIPLGHNAFVYVLSGELNIGVTKQRVGRSELAILDQGTDITIEVAEDCRYLLIAGKPLNEPIARGGPFVMNSREEINQAVYDYQNGQLV